MSDAEHTTAAIQRYLEALDTERPSDPIVRELLARSAERLQLISGNLLRRAYPRLMRPPLGLESDDLLDALVERLLKALRTVRPQTVRQFFALANQHMRWELNDLARRLDDVPAMSPVDSAIPDGSPASASSRSPNFQRILAAIESLGDDERECFSLVRIQGLSHGEAAEVLGVATKTVQRRLNRALLRLSDELDALRPAVDAG